LPDRSEYFRQYHLNNKERRNEYDREWRKNHPGYMTDYRNSHPEFREHEKQYKREFYRLRKDYWEKLQEQSIRFGEKNINVGKKVRTGFCSLCTNNIYDGSCKKTDMHHIKYHENDPLKDTIELCFSCHKTITWEIKRNSY